MRNVQRVERAVQSPMNPLRWCLELECGHECWVTQKKRPTVRKAECPDAGCCGHGAQLSDFTKRERGL